MSDAGATAGLQGHQGRGKTRKGECLKQGEEARRHSFPHFLSWASPGFGVSACLQCGVQGEKGFLFDLHIHQA